MGFNTTIEKLKQYVIVTADFKLANIPIIQPDVLQNHFYKTLGKELVDEIEAFESETDGTVKKRAFVLLENALAKLIVDDFLTKGQIQIDNGQVTRVETETTKTAYKNQIKDAKQSYFEGAYSAFDSLLELIVANAGDFTKWNDAPIKVNQAKLLVKTANEFNEIDRLNRKNLTFSALVPIQKTCIDLYLKSRFTATLINELIANAGLSTEKKQVREYLMTALVNFTVATGMQKNLVNFSAEGIGLVLHDEETASELRSKAELQAIEKQIDSYLDTGHRYISLTENYISNNLTAISTEDTEAITKTNPWM